MSFCIEANTLVSYTEEHGVNHVIIPDNVTKIGAMSFASCKGIETVTIPDSVNYIDDGAFMGCTSLKSITIPESVKTVGFMILSGCNAIEEINVPDGFTGLYNDDVENTKWYINNSDELMILGARLLKYNGHASEVIIPDGIKAIDDNAFEMCKELKSVTIPESVKEMGWGVFYDCYALETINVPHDFTLLDEDEIMDTKWYNDYKGDFIILGSALIKYKGNDTDVTVPTGVTKICGRAFWDCENLHSVSVPKSVKHIAKDAFIEGSMTELIRINA